MALSSLPGLEWQMVGQCSEPTRNPTELHKRLRNQKTRDSESNIESHYCCCKSKSFVCSLENARCVSLRNHLMWCCVRKCWFTTVGISSAASSAEHDEFDEQIHGLLRRYFIGSRRPFEFYLWNRNCQRWNIRQEEWEGRMEWHYWRTSPSSVSVAYAWPMERLFCSRELI